MQRLEDQCQALREHIRGLNGKVDDLESTKQALFETTKELEYERAVCMQLEVHSRPRPFVSAREFAEGLCGRIWPRR